MAGGSRTLDVVTVNLWGDNGPAEARMEELGRWLREEQPDVVLLQEVEDLAGLGGQAELLAAAAGYDHVEGIRTGRSMRRGEGLAVLSRHPLLAQATVPLPTARLDHPRALQQVDVSTPLGVVRVGNTHLAWRLGAATARTKQVRAIISALPPAGQPVVLGGDLNDVPGSAALEELTAAGFADCCAGDPQPRSTFDRANPFLWQPELADRRVDHLLARDLHQSEAGVVLDGAAGPVVSDHYGVRVLLEGGST